MLSHFRLELSWRQKMALTVFCNGLVRDGIRVLKNLLKKLGSKEPDWRLPGERLGEFGAGWNEVGKTFQKPFISITLRPLNLCGSEVYANAGAGKGSKDKFIAVIWNPDNLLYNAKSCLSGFMSGGLFGVCFCQKLNQADTQGVSYRRHSVQRR